MFHVKKDPLNSYPSCCPQRNETCALQKGFDLGAFAGNCDRRAQIHELPKIRGNEVLVFVRICAVVRMKLVKSDHLQSSRNGF